jgi:hypothetical protein
METVPTHKKFAIIHEMAGNHISIQELCKIAVVQRRYQTNGGEWKFYQEKLSLHLFLVLYLQFC